MSFLSCILRGIRSKRFAFRLHNRSHHMVNISALLNALPISNLEPEYLAWVRNLVGTEPGQHALTNDIILLEPPAGRPVPHVAPELALTTLLRHAGETAGDAARQARELVANNRDMTRNWVHYLDKLHADSQACAPCTDFVAWLRKMDFIPAQAVDFLDRACAETSQAELMYSTDDPKRLWSLAALPAVPPPKAMIDFMPGPPWYFYKDRQDMQADETFSGWRRAMRLAADNLEQSLGEPVYRFADLDDDYDDDMVHRFLVLHWCCTANPESAYVRFLVETSQASHLDELKAALLDPASYVHPHQMCDPFYAIEAKALRFDFAAQELIA